LLTGVVGDEPFDGVKVEHIVPNDAKKIIPDDFGSKGNPIGPLFSAGYKRVGKAPRKTLSIDVTDSVKDDLTHGRKVSGFRLQIPKGCNALDKKMRYIVFNGKTDSPDGPKLTLQLLEK
jgi:hypothetical protein